MDLYHSIGRRKSCRAYIQEPLTPNQLDELKKALDSFEPLYPNAPLEYRFTSETKGMFQVKAPHYLVFSGKGEEGEQENAGFIGQKLMLWLDAHERGGVWLGASKDATEQRKRADIIILAFGTVEGSPHREISEFRRKPIAEITNAVEDECIKAVHLAPSGMNIQPWYLEKREDTVKLYRQILKPPMSLAYTIALLQLRKLLSKSGISTCRLFGRTQSLMCTKKRDGTVIVEVANKQAREFYQTLKVKVPSSVDLAEFKQRTLGLKSKGD